MTLQEWNAEARVKAKVGLFLGLAMIISAVALLLHKIPTLAVALGTLGGAALGQASILHGVIHRNAPPQETKPCQR